MALLDRQRRYRRLGAIRIGTKSAKGAPVKLDTFRLTSQSQQLIKEAAGLYGGTVNPWDNPRIPGKPHWEVITEARELPVRIPEQVSEQMAWYEKWSKAGLHRKCDGFNDLFWSRPYHCPSVATGFYLQ